MAGQRDLRTAARRRALQAQAQRRQDAAEQERRLSALAVNVLVAVAERDAAVSTLEARAGEALRQMTETEGLSLREAVQWCGDGVSFREASRLRLRAGTPAAP